MEAALPYMVDVAVVVVAVAAAVVVVVGLGAVSYPEGLPNNSTEYAVNNVTRVAKSTTLMHENHRILLTLRCYNSCFDYT